MNGPRKNLDFSNENFHFIGTMRITVKYIAPSSPATIKTVFAYDNIIMYIYYWEVSADYFKRYF